MACVSRGEKKETGDAIRPPGVPGSDLLGGACLGTHRMESRLEFSQTTLSQSTGDVHEPGHVTEGQRPSHTDRPSVLGKASKK